MRPDGPREFSLSLAAREAVGAGAPLRCRETVGASSTLGKIMEPVMLLDAAGRRPSAATMPGHRRGQAPRNRACAIAPILRPSKKSCSSCAAPAIASDWSASGSGSYRWDVVGTILAEKELPAWREAGARTAFRWVIASRRRRVGVCQFSGELLELGRPAAAPGRRRAGARGPTARPPAAQRA